MMYLMDSNESHTVKEWDGLLSNVMDILFQQQRKIAAPAAWSTLKTTLDSNEKTQNFDHILFTLRRFNYNTRIKHKHIQLILLINSRKDYIHTNDTPDQNPNWNIYQHREMKECTRFLVSPVDAVFLFKETLFWSGFRGMKRAMRLGRACESRSLHASIGLLRSNELPRNPTHLTKSGKTKPTLDCIVIITLIAVKKVVIPKRSWAPLRPTPPIPQQEFWTDRSRRMTRP